MEKLGMSLDDMIKTAPGGGKGRGKGKGAGGAIKAGRGAGKTARAAAAPYQKPMKKGKGMGGAPATLADMAAAAAPQVVAPAASNKPAFVLTTGTTVRVGNLDFGVSAEDIEELFSELGPLKSATLATKPDGSSKGFALVTYKRKADAETALERYNGVPLDGKPLKLTLQQNVAPATSAANVVVTSPGGGRGAANRVVTLGGKGGKGGKGGRGRGRGGAAFAVEEDEAEETGFGGRGKGKGKGKGKGGGKGGGKGRGGGKGGDSKPQTMEDLDADLDAYKQAAE